jgi:hypothetical protein
MNQTNNKTFAFGLLFFGVAGAIVYFLFFKNKAAAATPKTTVLPGTKPAAKTVAQKIIIGYDKGLASLSDVEVKKYATWLDRIAQLFVISRNERKNQYAVPNQEVITNIQALDKLSDDNLRAVVNYYHAVRGGNIVDVLDKVLDEKEQVIPFLFRLKELKIYP